MDGIARTSVFRSTAIVLLFGVVALELTRYTEVA
jgi:hypothetical protein